MRGFCIFGLLLVSLAAVSQQSANMMDKKQSGIPVDAGHDPSMCAPDGVAVGGFDLVSYHNDAGPQPGLPQFAAEHGAFKYLFQSQTNLDQFNADPERYLPSYSGFCAITLALGRIMCPDYLNFKIEDGDLLLFETTGFTNGRVVWDTDPPSFRKKADVNYETLKSNP